MIIGIEDAPPPRIEDIRRKRDGGTLIQVRVGEGRLMLSFADPQWLEAFGEGLARIGIEMQEQARPSQQKALTESEVERARRLVG